MVSNSDMTLNFMQAMASFPSEHPDRISSTNPSMGVPFQKAGLAGWAIAEPKMARAKIHITFPDMVLEGALVIDWLINESRTVDGWTDRTELLISGCGPIYLYRNFFHIDRIGCKTE